MQCAKDKLQTESEVVKVVDDDDGLHEPRIKKNKRRAKDKYKEVIDVEEIWARTDRMHEVTEKNKIQRYKERMHFDREMVQDFFGII